MRIVPALLLPIFGVQAAAAAVPAIDDAWAKGDYRSAFAQAIEPAIKGDAHAQFLIGEAYRLGRSVDPNFPLAEQWYARAARQGDVAAATELGLLLAAQHMERVALPWLAIAARHGEPRALCSLAAIYFNGDAVPRDEPRAFALMARAAALGLPEAKTRLATLRTLLSPEAQARGEALDPTAHLPESPPAVRAVVPPTGRRTAERTPSIRIQVGAFRSVGAAEQAWARLSSKVAGVAHADHAVVQAGAVYRLQAELTDGAAARDFRRRLAGAGWQHFIRQGNGSGRT